MDKTYKPDLIETQIYQYWEAQGYFAPTSNTNGQSYCIMLPPPNVTGNLHMGHAFQQTLMDILIRYHRMNGDETLWQCGTDHAGIATQMVVERQLQQAGQKRYELGREAFIDKIWDWKQQSGNIITQQSRRLGASMDWSRERFTMDDNLSQAVTEAFVRLYDDGLIYRGKRLVNWDPVLQTAISDLEVVAEEEEGYIYYIKYPLLVESTADQAHLIVATTRPETMLGDAAVAVHPDDPRYQNLIGKKIKLPIADRDIPIIADSYVDPEFGTGCVKITPAHDFNDYEVWKRHKEDDTFRGVPEQGLFNIFASDASIITAATSSVMDEQHYSSSTFHIGEFNPNEGKYGIFVDQLIRADYHGLDRYEARDKIVAELEYSGLLQKKEPHRHMVPRGDRSHAVIEPYLTMQWFIKTDTLAAPAIEAVKTGQVKFVPTNWDKTYYEWMNHIEDWCISRQLWWGHRIPAWYDREGNHYVGYNEEYVREKYKEELLQIKESYNNETINLKQDEDVLDTWFSSALWPCSTLGWPQKTPDLAKFYPSNVLVTGFDIIFFWVARMIMFGLYFMDKKFPFKEVYIHGLVRDGEGQKMSKSKGNVIDPIDLIDGITLTDLIQKRTHGLMQPQIAAKIEKSTRKHFPDGIEAYGTDALRFTFASLATGGRFINFETGRIQGYRNFCNKLWNASRYVQSQVATLNFQSNMELGVAEKWILTKLSTTISKTHESIKNYRFDLAAQALYEFTWDEYCAWYIELSKITLNTNELSIERKTGTLHTLLNVLEILQRALHPFMPFITEQLWRSIAPLLEIKGDSIMLEPYPSVAALPTDETAMAEIEWLKVFVMSVRRIRAERDIAPSKLLTVFVKNGSAVEFSWLKMQQMTICAIAKISTIKSTETEINEAIVAQAGEMTLLIPLAELIDVKQEQMRLNKNIEKLKQKVARLEQQLANANFVLRAPKNVVDATKQQLTQTTKEIDLYQKQLGSINNSH